MRNSSELEAAVNKDRLEGIQNDYHANWLKIGRTVNLQNISGVLEAGKRIKFIDNLNMGCFKIWLNKSFVHRIHLQEKTIVRTIEAQISICHYIRDMSKKRDI